MMGDYDYYSCPKCGKNPPDFEYTENGKKYPIVQNEVRYYNGHFNMHDWDETHFCCNEEYIFTNGSV